VQKTGKGAGEGCFSLRLCNLHIFNATSPEPAGKEAVMARKKKETRITDELKRLDELFQALPANKYALVLPLLENAAFMKVELEDLRAVIAATGATESYQNGANQKGQKASAELQAYTALIKQYNTISERLEKMLPAEAAKSKLAEILAA